MGLSSGPTLDLGFESVSLACTSMSRRFLFLLYPFTILELYRFSVVFVRPNDGQLLSIMALSGVSPGEKVDSRNRSFWSVVWSLGHGCSRVERSILRTLMMFSSTRSGG